MSGDWLLEMLSPKRMPHIVDIGANPIDGDAPYKALLDRQLVKVTGFEPQEQALRALNERKTALETYLPYVIGQGGPAMLNICQYSGWTSLKQPRKAALDVFTQFKESAEILRTVEVDTHRLDDVNEAADFDLLKIDVQGAELDVLGGAVKKLANAVIVQSEISFINLYQNQPTFGQIDAFLRAQSFVPHTFSAIKRALISPITYKDSPSTPYNQILEADIVYVRDYFDFPKFTDDQIKQLCFLVCRVYRSYDLAARCVVELANRGAIASNAFQIYLENINREQAT